MIPVYSQIISEHDAKAVYNCVKKKYITQAGEEVTALEGLFANFIGRKYACLCSNGTAALHLCLLSHKIKGVVAVPACTFASVAFAPLYERCDIEYIDVDRETWNIDINKLEELCKIKKISAVIAVHNYGNPYDYESLLKLSDKYGFLIIEDACEALGSTYNSKYTGNFGNISVFSFFGNKVITGGEGGIVLTDDKRIYDEILLLRSQYNEKYDHRCVGYNYRITSMQAALIMSQFKSLNDRICKMKNIHNIYKNKLFKFCFQKEIPTANSCWWMNAILCDNENIKNNIIDNFNKNEIDYRPLFPPLSNMSFNNTIHGKYPVASYLNAVGFVLPSGPGLSLSNINKICKILNNLV